MRKCKEKKAVKACIYIIAGLLMIILGYCFLSAFIQTADMKYNLGEVNFYTSDSISGNLIELILLVGLLFLADKIFGQIKPSHLFWISSCILAAFMIYLVSEINLSPTYDANYTLIAARQLLRGDYRSMYAGSYVSHYSFQIPLILYNCLLIRIFGDNTIVPQLFNIVYLIGIHYCQYRITEILSSGSKRAMRLSILFSFFFFPLSMYIMFLYSNIPSLFFLMAGLLETVKWSHNEKGKDLILAYILIGVSSLFKGTSLVALIALTIVVILKQIQKFNWKQILTAVLCISLTLLTPKWNRQFFEAKDKNVDLNSSYYVEYALYMGSMRSSRGAGWYNGSLMSYLDQMDGTEQNKKKEADRLIQENYQSLFSSPQTFFSFYADKLDSMWTNPEFQGFWTIEANKESMRGKGSTDRQSWGWIYYDPTADTYDSFTESYMNGNINKDIRTYLNIFQNLIYLFSFLYVFMGICRKRLGLNQLILPLTFLGGFLFLSFWEAKAQYSILFFVLLFPLAACELDQVFHWIHVIILKKSNGGTL